VDTACTLEDSIISFIPKDDFLEALRTSPILSNRLLKSLSHEFVVFVNGISVFAYKTVRERLALSLLILKNKYRKEVEDDQDVEITVSREDLAKMVGTARETLTRLIKEFKDDGLIETTGKRIIIIKPLEISKIANVY
jgi:CRP-like cAMP-binding protein